jgi:hypothetical protein
MCANNVFGSSINENVRNSKEQRKIEYRIQGGGPPGTGIPNILEELMFYTEIWTPDISAKYPDEDAP